MANSETIAIKIKVDGDYKNIEVGRKQINSLGRAFSNVDTVANSLKATVGKIALVGIGLNTIPEMIKKTIGIIDDFSNTTGRIKLVTSSFEELRHAQKKLLEISNEARVSYSSSADLYARLGRSLKQLSIPQEKMLQATEAISKSLIISGASSESANAALVQLGQGLAANALRGQELMSVMEQTPRLAEAIANGLGVGIGELRKLAEQGKLTSKVVFDSILSQKNILESEFKQMPKTVGQSITVLGNSFTYLLGQINDNTKGTQGLSSAIGILSSTFTNNVEPIVIFFSDIKRGFEALGTTIAITTVEIKLWIEYIKYAHYKAGSFINLNNETRENYKKLAHTSSREIDLLKRQSALLVGEYTKIKNSYGKLEHKIQSFPKTVQNSFAGTPTLLGTSTSGVDKWLDKARTSLLSAKQKILNEADIFRKELSQKLSKATSQDERIKLTNKLVELERVKNEKISSLQEKAHTKSNQSAKSFLNEKAKLYEDFLQRNMNQEEKTYDNINKYANNVYKHYKNNLELANKMVVDFATKRFDEMENTKKALHVKRLKEDQYYYKKIGEYEKAWQIEKLKLNEKYKNMIFANGKKITKEELKKVLSIHKKEFFEPYNKEAKSSFKEMQSDWEKVTSAMGQSIEDNLFNFMKGGFKDIKSMWKKLGNDLLSNITSPIYRNISGGIANMFTGNTNVKSVASVAKQMGLSLVNGQWQGGGDTNGSANIILSTTGEVVKGGNLISQLAGKSGTDFMGILSKASSAKSVLGFLSNPMATIKGFTSFLTNPLATIQGMSAGSIGSGILGGIGSLASEIYGATGGALGLTATGFTAGAGGSLIYTGTSFAGGTGAGMSIGANGGVVPTAFLTPAGFALLGAAGGFGIGSLGDMLFKANTYAPVTGAVGGAIGGAVGAGTSVLSGIASTAWAGPVGILIGGILGSVIGGLFGKTKQIGGGMRVLDHITADSVLNPANLQGYKLMQKKSWFDEKEWKETYGLDEKTYKQIEGQLDGIQNLLETAGALEKFALWTGDWSDANFWESNMPLSIIAAMTDFPHLVTQEAQNIDLKGMFSKFSGNIKEQTTTAMQEVANPKFYEIYDAWKAYAKKIDKTVMEAMSQSLQSMIQTKRTFNEWILKDDSVALAKFKAQTAKQDAQNAARILGVNFADLTAKNFLEKYNTAIRESFDPDIINNWNNLSKAFMGASNAQNAYINSVLKSTQNMYNAQIALTQAMGKDASKLMLEAKRSEILGWAKNTFSSDKNSSSWNMGSIDVWANELKKLQTNGTLADYVGIDGNTAELTRKIAEYISLQNQIKNQQNTANNVGFNPTSTSYQTPMGMYDFYKRITSKDKQIADAIRDMKLGERVVDVKDRNGRKIAIDYKYMEFKDLTKDILAQRLIELHGTLDTYEEITKVGNALGILDEALKGTAETLEKFNTSTLTSVSASFKNIINTSQSFIDKVMGKNKDYITGNYKSAMQQAEALNRVIQGGNYKLADVKALDEAVKKASQYGQSYFSSKTFDNEWQENFERTVSAHKFAEINKTATREQKTIDDVVEELKALRGENKQQSNDLLTIQRQLRDAQNEILMLKKDVSNG